MILTPFLACAAGARVCGQPLGVQEDGTITEGAGRTWRTGSPRATGPPPTDLSPDFVYESKGHADPVRLRDRGPDSVPQHQVSDQRDPQDWGINIVRKVQHSGHEDTWVPDSHCGRVVPRAVRDAGRAHRTRARPGAGSQSVRDREGALARAATTATPSGGATASSAATGRPTSGGASRTICYSTAPTGPDFAEVESDATQVQFDPRNAVSVSRRSARSSSMASSSSTHRTTSSTRGRSRRRSPPRSSPARSATSTSRIWARRTTGLAVAGGGGHPLFNVVRVLQRRRLGVADRRRGHRHEDGRLVQPPGRRRCAVRVWTISTRWRSRRPAAVRTTQRAGASTGSRRNGVAGRGSALGGALHSRRTHIRDRLQRHRHRPGIRCRERVHTARGIANVTTRPSAARSTAARRLSSRRSPATSPSTTPGCIGSFTSAEAPEDRRWHFTGTATLFGGWQLGGGIYFETYGYDPTLYSNYYLGHIVGARHHVHAVRRHAADPQHRLRLHVQHAAVRQVSAVKLSTSPGATRTSTSGRRPTSATRR